MGALWDSIQKARFMMKDSFSRLAGVRVRTIFGVTALVAALAALSVASVAQAAPKGEYEKFGQCPTSTAEACIYAQTESGEFVVGKKTVPIEKTIVLQGGFRENAEEELEFLAAKNGETITKAPQNVPGGLSGLVNCKEIKGNGLLEIIERGSCEAIFENGVTGVTATTELAAPASGIKLNEGNLLGGEGTALLLPVKVHLENPLLGSSCYVGSNSSPIDIALTTGTTSPPAPNKPIKGNVGSLEFNKTGTILTISKNSLVNNSFSAPATSGCGGLFEFLIGPIINSELGVPSAAGHNTAILNGTLKQAGAEAVVESEK